MLSRPASNEGFFSQPTVYTRLLVFIGGLGGLLYGIDVGIISAALLYLNKTINLSEQQTSAIVAAVLGGSMASSLVAGLLADWVGRKKMLIVSALLFVLSVGLIVISQSFLALLLGRLLQGMSGGVIAVVVPLYLAECLNANTRGKGTVIFQFMLTLGIVVAAVAGLYYSQQAETAIAAAAGHAARITAAQDHAWRSMFLSVVYPGLLFLAGTFFVSESPRWLFRRHRTAEALAALRRTCSEDEAQERLREMQAAHQAALPGATRPGAEPLLQRKYVVPFLLACVILGCNQATGINSILQFLVVILKQAGLNTALATRGDTMVKVLNCVMTLAAFALVERKGRKFLLKLGTGGIIVALLLTALTFRGFESKRVDVRAKVQAAVVNNAVSLPVASGTFELPSSGHAPISLTVLYTYGDGEKTATVLSSDDSPVLKISPAADKPAFQFVTLSPLIIERALAGPVPSAATGWLVTLCLALFIASFSIGPGVCVWLALSELMPTRIRSTGMGIALLINQGVSTAIAAVFLPVVGNYGYASMFLFWAGCTVIYFITAAFFLPETKGKTLEEIEACFETPKAELKP